tara:strand:+ start:1050 stop:1445 length:396 start_codon:yes stop_codon:yes gene_type:complete
MIELVPMAYRVVNEVDAAALDDRIPAKAGHESVKSSSVASNVRDGGTTSTAGGTIGGVGAGGAGRKMDEEEERDAVFYRLEMLGYRVGQGLVERFVLCSMCSYIPIPGVPLEQDICWEVGKAIEEHGMARY